MPDSLPVEGAPENYWAGQSDAQLLADTAGLGWLQPAFAAYQPRMINIATLCASPPPVAPLFTTLDLAKWYLPGAPREESEVKLHAMVDRSLWVQFCQFTDATPAPTIDPQPPPTDLPPNEPDPDPINYLPDIYAYVKWLTRETVPRHFHPSGSITVTGTGDHTWPSNAEGEYPVECAGLRVELLEHQDYNAHTDDEALGLWWDLGWLSVGDGVNMQPPFRIQRQELIVYGIVMPITSCRWNLANGVELRITALYPDTPNMPSG